MSFRQRVNAFLVVVSLLSFMLTGSVWAKEKPQSQAVFLAQVFGTELPQAEMIRLSEADKKSIKAIFFMPFPTILLRNQTVMTIFSMGMGVY